VFEDGLDLLRNFGLAGEIRAVDLCDESPDDRRSWRYFADLNASAVLVADDIEQRTKPLGNGMALHAALLGRQQVHLNVGLVRLAAHVVVAHEPIEVIGTGSSCVGLIVEHVRLLRKFIS
jgi:hypothetical protein